jgi:hypothetical protein
MHAFREVHVDGRISGGVLMATVLVVMGVAMVSDGSSAGSICCY